MQPRSLDPPLLDSLSQVTKRGLQGGPGSVKFGSSGIFYHNTTILMTHLRRKS